jgi:hypothetical protein
MSERVTGAVLAERLQRLPFVERALWEDDKGFEMFGDIGVLALRAPGGYSVGRAFPPALNLAER